MMKCSVREMILISLFAALTAVGAFIKIPTPLVPYTLQFLFCAYAGVFLGAKHGLYSQLLYVGIGLIGIPVFTNGGGPTYVLQPTFGFLPGFMLCAYIIGWVVERSAELKFYRIFGAVLAGLAALYVAGVSYLYIVVNFYLQKPMSYETAIALGCLPYIAPDILLGLIISLTSLKVAPILRRLGYVRPARIAATAAGDASLTKS